MKKRSIWDILVYVALIVLVIWIILKLAGVINSPVIVEIIPYVSAAYVFGRMFQKVETTADDVEKINTEIREIKDETKSIDKRIQVLEIKNGFKKK